MENYPEVLKDLADHVAFLMTERGEKAEAAAEIGFKTAEFLREHWGGQKIYIPKGITFAASQRDIEIYGRFRGTNALDLCREYKITNTRLYQIIHAMRKFRRPPDPEQPELFKEVAK
ncbi:MAG: DNA-binding protein [Deltaproteobacteria bacterium]|nr:MAG: DNA-binding protein [Deltaproteobacteria bacterium]